MCVGTPNGRWSMVDDHGVMASELPPAAGSGETRVNNRVLGGAPAITVFLKGGGFTLLRLGSQAKQIQPFLQLVARINTRGMKINQL